MLNDVNIFRNPMVAICKVHPTKHVYQSSPNCGRPNHLYPFDGGQYCALHLPDPQKASYTDFDEIVKSRIAEEDFDFSYVFFPSDFRLERFRAIDTLVTFANATFHRNFSAEDVEFNSYLSFQDAIFHGKADFSGSKFTEFYFFGTEFNSTVDFSSSRFKGVAYFWKVTFHAAANFRAARFFDRASFAEVHATNPQPPEMSLTYPDNPNIDFSQAKFLKDFSLTSSEIHNASFFRTRFKKGVDFACTKVGGKWTFPKADFTGDADFTAIEIKEGAEIEFAKCVFRNHVTFDNSDFFQYHSFEKSKVDFTDAYFEQPERCRFHAVALRPRWFLGVDCRKINFRSIAWIDFDGSPSYVKSEYGAVEPNLGPGRLLLTYRQLAENYEASRRFETASNFRRASFETQWLQQGVHFGLWWNEEFAVRDFVRNLVSKVRGIPVDFAHFLYRYSSYYGEKPSRAFFVLILLIAGFAIFYSSSLGRFSPEKSIGIIEGFSYSLRVMLLQRPEPAPGSDLTKLMVALEGILAPAQLALLALALRRKFMT